MARKLTPSEKAARTGRWAETMFRALTRRVADRWQLVSFRGRKGSEWRGIVDVLAIRKATGPAAQPDLKPGDLFDIIIVQLKGGNAPDPTAVDVRRLLAVRRVLKARAVVLYSWKRRSHSTYRRLDVRSGQWRETTADAVFG
jgi:hypothetical protein